MHGLFLPVSPQLAPSRGTMKCWVWAGWPGSRPCFGGEGKEEYLAHHEHADGNGTSQRNVGRVTEWQQAAFIVCPYAQGMQFKQQTVFSFFPAVGVGEKLFCQTYGESGVIVLSVWFIWCETKFWHPRVPKPLWSCQLGQLLSPWFPRCLGRFIRGLTVAGSGPSTCTDPAVAVATMHCLHPHLYFSAPIALHQKGVRADEEQWGSSFHDPTVHPNLASSLLQIPINLRASEHQFVPRFWKVHLFIVCIFAVCRARLQLNAAWCSENVLTSPNPWPSHSLKFTA